MGKLAKKRLQIPQKVKRGQRVPSVEALNSKFMGFSFKNLDLLHDKFSVSEKDKKYFVFVLERLKSLSTFTREELISNRSRSLRAHPITWNKTSEPLGFRSLNKKFKDYIPYQITICANKHGRVHGFFMNNLFHIVWLDPEHNLYP